MRILVTGGAGFIGSHIVDTYLDHGHDVAIADSLWPHGGGKRANVPTQARFYRIDVADPDIAEVFARERPEVVNHHAAQQSVKISTDDPALDARFNVLGVLNVLENCRLYGVRKVIFASSAATYGNPLTLPVHEQTPQRPESPYGITKVVGEHYLRYYSERYALHSTVFRYANVYGPRQHRGGEAGVVAAFAEKMLRNSRVRIDWDGQQARDFVYVGDIARANLLALEPETDGTYCLGTGRGTSINELYQALANLLGRNVPIDHAPMRAGDIRACYFDCTKARRDLGWVPEVSLTAGLAATVAFQQRAEAALRSTPPVVSPMNGAAVSADGQVGAPG